VKKQQWSKGWWKTKKEGLEREPLRPCPGECGWALEAKCLSKTVSGQAGVYVQLWGWVLAPGRSSSLPSLARLSSFSASLTKSFSAQYLSSGSAASLSVKRPSAFEENVSSVQHCWHSPQQEEPSEWGLKLCDLKPSSSLPETCLI